MASESNEEKTSINDSQEKINLKPQPQESLPKNAAYNHIKKCKDESERDKESCELLKLELELVKMKEKIAQARRNLPWVQVNKDFALQDIDGKDVKFSQLFKGSPTNDLIVISLMFDPTDSNPCPFCSLWGDGYSSVLRYIETRCNFAVISRAKPQQLKKIAKIRNWTFKWYSCYKDPSFVDYYQLREIKTDHQKMGILAFHYQLDANIEQELINSQKNSNDDSINKKEEKQESNMIGNVDTTKIEYKGIMYNTYIRRIWDQDKRNDRVMDFATIVWNLFDILPCARGSFMPKADYPN